MIDRLDQRILTYFVREKGKNHCTADLLFD